MYVTKCDNCKKYIAKGTQNVVLAVDRPIPNIHLCEKCGKTILTTLKRLRLLPSKNN